MTNPNPNVIPDAIWWLWTQATTYIPGVRLGGIYANKSGYHNTVDANQASWPGNYSIQLPPDLKKPHTKARALDLTMDAGQMKLRTGYLKTAALHPEDDRLDALREFYGTLDSVNVYGLIHNGPGQAWSRSTSDSSHLWHIHLSVFTEFCPDFDAMAAVSSVLSGQTWEQWNNQTPEEDDPMHKIRSGGPDGSIYLVPGYAAPSGRMAAYALDAPRNETYADVKMYQLPNGVTVPASGYYDVDPQPWPTGGGGKLEDHVHEFTGAVGPVTP